MCQPDKHGRNYVKAIRLSDGHIASPLDFAHNPMNGGAHARIEIPAGVVLVEHSIFCGHDCGLTVIEAPASALDAVAS